MSLISTFRTLFEVNPWKTIYFNLHYFPMKTAIRMPFFIYWRSELYKLNGKIVIDAPVRTGMIKFGAHGLGTQDLFYSRTMIQLYGTVVVKGKACIGRGSKISVGREARLTFGENFMITGDSQIICHKEITFGNDCLLSWDILMMDTDFHHVLDTRGYKTNMPKPISIGNHVWIGCKTVILKGVSLADDTIVSANSTITRSFEEPNCIIGGHAQTAAVLRHSVCWEK